MGTDFCPEAAILIPPLTPEVCCTTRQTLCPHLISARVIIFLWRLHKADSDIKSLWSLPIFSKHFFKTSTHKIIYMYWAPPRQRFWHVILVNVKILSVGQNMFDGEIPNHLFIFFIWVPLTWLGVLVINLVSCKVNVMSPRPLTK